MRADIVKRMRDDGEQHRRGERREGRVDDPRPEVPIPPVINDAELTQRALPIFEQLVGKDNVRLIGLQTVADDFSFFGQRRCRRCIFWVGITPPGKDPATVPFNHSPLFYLDESGLITGVRAMLAVTTDFLAK